MAATYLASFSYGLTIQSVPPVLPLLIKDFHLAHAQAGLAQSLFALPMIFLAIPAGFLADRLPWASSGSAFAACSVHCRH